MEWSDARVKISLSDRPRIVQMGFGSHGRVRKESFCFECWTLHIYYYNGNICVNGADFPIRFGYMGVNPPNAETIYRFDEPSCRHIWVHFKADRKENKPMLRLLPIMHDVSKDFNRFNQPMEEILRCYATEHLRVEVILWELLFRLAESAGKNINTMQTRHPAVTLSMEYIENNLSQFLPTKNVLKAVGLSHNHLNRLFSAGLGKTIREYILERRMVKAAYFLTSTRIPVKCAAIECGLPNLQHFNKIIHRYFGMAPTQLRRKAALETEKTS